MTFNVDIHVVNNFLLIINSTFLVIISFRYRELRSEIEETRVIRVFMTELQKQNRPNVDITEP